MSTVMVETLPSIVDRSEVAKTEEETSRLVELAKSIVVTDITSCQFAEQFSGECARREKEIDKRFSPAREQTHKAWKTVTELIASLKTPNTEAKQIADNKAREWRRSEQKRLSEEAERQRQEEKKRLEEENLKKAEEALNSGTKEGEALAERLMNEEVVVAPRQIDVLPKTEGTSYREKWTFGIVNVDLIPREYLEPDRVKIGGVVRALKGATKIPGIQVWDEGTTVHKTKE